MKPRRSWVRGKPGDSRVTAVWSALVCAGGRAGTPAVVATLVVSALCGVATAGTNLILNPGFEDGESPLYPGVGLHWETNDGLEHPDIDVLTTETKHSGAWSQWLKAHDTWDLGMVRQVTPYNSITAGNTYWISAWVKTANVENPAGWYVFGLWWMNNEGGVVLRDDMPRPETNNYDWREITWPRVAPSGATRVAALLTRHTDGDAWYDDVFIAEVTPGPPEIGFSPASFSHKVSVGDSLPDDTFQVQNVGDDILDYTISDDAGWLSADPSAGETAGEIEFITISYSIAGLGVGIYHADITIDDPNATNSPATLPVTVIVRTPGDFDYDGDVDQGDFGFFQACLSGPGEQVTGPCTEADLDLDGGSDVDEADFELFQKCLSGPGVPSDPQCAG